MQELVQLAREGLVESVVIHVRALAIYTVLEEAVMIYTEILSSIDLCFCIGALTIKLTQPPAHPPPRATPCWASRQTRASRPMSPLDASWRLYR